MFLWFITSQLDAIKNKQVRIHPSLSVDKTFYISAKEAKKAFFSQSRPLHLVSLEVDDVELLGYFGAALANYDIGAPDYHLVMWEELDKE